MRRIMAAVLGAIGVFACGDFGGGDSVPEANEPDGGDAPRKPARDGGTTTSETDAAAGTVTCTTASDQPFDKKPIGWDGPRKAGNADVAIDFGPQSLPGLVAGAELLAGQVGVAIYERTIDGLSFTSGRASFDFAYSELQPTSTVGCALGVTRKAPFNEARIALGQEQDGLKAVSGFIDEGGGVASQESVPVAAITAQAWTHVTFELRLAADGFVERRATIDGKETELSRFEPKPPVTAFDGVHLICGIIGAQGPAIVQISVKSFVVETCGP